MSEEPRRGRRAFFSDPTEDASAAPADVLPAGRRALFSEPIPTAQRAGRFDAIVHCRTCLATTPLSPLALGVSMVPSLWLPTRPWPRLMRCPACHRVSWCRIEWPRLTPAGLK